MEILHWPVSQELKSETEQHYRTGIAHRLADAEPLSIIRQVTFDNIVPNITLSDVKKLFDYVMTNFLPPLKGQGLEVGAGPGTFSSILASYELVKKMYALEVCAPIVELLMPSITEFILRSEKEKVTGVVGDFDRVQLPEQSVDFLFDFFSLHHSSNLAVTLKECYRVLKPGGFIFCFDKARPDYFTEEDLNQLLDAEYDAHTKTSLFGMPADKKFTRRMNGEKEYRLKDWKRSFNFAGFKRVEYFYLSKTLGSSSLAGFIKSCLAFLPPQLQIQLTQFMPAPKHNHKFILADENRVFIKEVNIFPKEISLLIAHA